MYRSKIPAILDRTMYSEPRVYNSYGHGEVGQIAQHVTPPHIERRIELYVSLIEIEHPLGYESGLLTERKYFAPFVEEEAGIRSRAFLYVRQVEASDRSRIKTATIERRRERAQAKVHTQNAEASRRRAESIQWGEADRDGTGDTEGILEVEEIEQEDLDRD